ncbi:MAG: sodium/solute symporter [Melioribacteraceae bacterium]|nr:sodium/solute symporter [Melioribacteraceae bacterium]
MIESSLTILDVIIIIAYFIFIVWLGAKFKKNQKDTRRYFLGKQNIPGWAVGMSLFATIISSWTFIALPGKAFKTDLQYMVNILILPICAFIASKFLIALFRNKIKLSAYEYLEKRFGIFARIYGNLAFLIVHFGKMAAILYLLSLTVSGITGWNIFVLILLIGIATILYTFYGGIEGVVWSEVIQGFLLIGGGIVTVLFILFTFPGGASDLISETINADKLKLWSFDFTWTNQNSIVLIFFGLNYWMQKYVSDQTVVQRYLLASSEKGASKAIWISSVLIMMIWVLFMSIGAFLWTYYKFQPGLLPETLMNTPDKVYPYFIGHQLPSGLTGIILSALLAATMSTLSSDLNALGSIIYDDYYNKLRKNRNDRQRLKFSRITVLVAGILCVFLAMAFTSIQSMADAAFDFVALVAGGILGMYFLGIFTRRTSPKGLYVGLAFTVVAILYLFISNSGMIKSYRFISINTLWIGLIGNVITLVIGYLTSLILTPNYSAEPGLIIGKSHNNFPNVFNQEK